VRGEPDATQPVLVRVHVKNPLSDVLHWQRADFGISVAEAMAAVAEEGSGVVVVLADSLHPEDLLARIGEQPEKARSPTSDWRRNGAGAQILADLGLRRLRVLGTPRKQVALAGYGLEVVEYLPGRPSPA